MNILSEFFSIVDVFARGGGGGSGGGGGGGSGGSGGSGGGESIFVAIGFGVGNGLARIMQKIFGDDRSKLPTIIATAVLSVLLVILVIISGSFLAWYIDILVIIGVWTGVYTRYHRIWDKYKAKIKKTGADITKARQSDSIWDEPAMIKFATDTFIRYQDDWTRLDTANLTQYSTSRFAQKTALQMQLLRDLNRQNAVMNPTILKIDTVNITDSPDDTQDTFTVLIDAKANDMLIDVSTSQTIFQDNSEFSELWTFVRNGESWLLSIIDQTTASVSSINTNIRQFAEQNGMYYSADMGWLFLPARGQVFSRGAFGVSDINNQVVGMYNGILIQIYTYQSGAQNDHNYIIGQITVPKNYGNILIRPKESFIAVSSIDNVKQPPGTEKYQFEWTNFNHKFEVFASQGDRLASFELVNPSFMANMYDIDEKIVLEVADNIIYFRASYNTKPETYPKLLDLLKQAHKELKL